MSGTIRISHSRADIRGMSTEGTSAHLEDTQFIGFGLTIEAAVEDLVNQVKIYGWSANPNDYQIVGVHLAP